MSWLVRRTLKSGAKVPNLSDVDQKITDRQSILDMIRSKTMQKYHLSVKERKKILLVNLAEFISTPDER